MSDHPLQVAVIGAGPAGIYAADTLIKTGRDVKIDLFDRLPAPYGLVRYGVAPDHPRIRGIITALYNVLKRGDIRFLGNVNVGEHISLEELHCFYDAIIIATGANADRPLGIPGEDLPGSFGGADFVSWYDGHPDYPRTWDLSASDIAIIGVGNVALDISRILAKDPDALAVTEIPPNVEEGLRASKAKNVHIFGRRGPAQVKFTPLELRELGEAPGLDVQVYPEDFQYDDASEKRIEDDRITRQVVEELTEFAFNDPEDMHEPRRIHIHLLSAPVEIYGDGKVEGIRIERTRLTGDGRVEGTGEIEDYPVQAVYRAIGYASAPIEGAPWDPIHRVIPNVGGRAIADGQQVEGLYVTGWVKRGPVGLIGSTKSDAKETITNLGEDVDAGKVHATGAGNGGEGVLELLRARGVRWTTWDGWERLEDYEKQVGAQRGRERTKVVDRETMTAISRGEEHDGKVF